MVFDNKFRSNIGVERHYMEGDVIASYSDLYVSLGFRVNFVILGPGFRFEGVP